MKSRYGLIKIPENDLCQYAWLSIAGASPEDEQINILKGLLSERPKGIFCDVGANFGCWTMPIYKYATSTYAFEPQPRVAQLLHETVELNNAQEEVLVCRFALGDEEGVVQIADLPLETAHNFGGVVIGQPEEEAPMVVVPIRTLDNFLEEIAPGEHVSFIKIDVETYEPKVLRGAENTILRYRPLMFIEWAHGQIDGHAEILPIIEEYGYSYERQGPNLLCIPVF